MRLTDGERKTLAEIGKRLGKRALAEVATIVQPDTILAWHRRPAVLEVTALRSVRPSGAQPLPRRWRYWSSAWRKNIVPGVMIALPAPCGIWLHH